jgi:hypothetical protein
VIVTTGDGRECLPERRQFSVGANLLVRRLQSQPEKSPRERVRSYRTCSAFLLYKLLSNG